MGLSTLPASKPSALTSRPFHAGWGNDTGQPNLGDYIQAVAQNGELFAAWANTEQKGFTDGQPTSGSFTTPDAAFQRTSGGARAPLRMGTLTFTDSGGNGFIDPSETINIKIPLVNYVTNPGQAGTASGITGTLSTTTAGVTVTGTTSAYPSITPNGTGQNTSNFVLVTSPGFVPGTPIELKLAVTAVQGPVTLLTTVYTGTPTFSTLLSENFNGVAAGSLPAGWTAAHAGGNNTVPWTTNSTFCNTTSNAAFHVNANDGNAGAHTRFERLFSPLFVVPANAVYVDIEMDVCYDTEDEPALNIQAYDGFLLRITDQTTGNILRSVLAEAFAQEFTTGSIFHYPKHFPRNSNTSYFQDMSAWAGDSQGWQHVHMRLPGMAGTTAQLRFEYTQDSGGICSDIRPGHSCGVAFDNLVIKSVTIAPPPGN